MGPRVLKGLGAALLMLAVSATGCGSQYRKDLDRLKGDYNELAAQKLELQGRLSRSDLVQASLRTQLTDAQRQLSAERARAQALEGQAVQSREALQEARRPSDSEKRLYEVTLGSDILFSAGSATLTPAGRTALGKVAAKIKADHPSRIVRVYGFTDSDPIVKSKKLWTDNLDLSANRAMAVTRYMIAQGIKADRVETVAMGASRSVASNKTKSGKSKNRRVEIIVIQK